MAMRWLTVRELRGWKAAGIKSRGINVELVLRDQHGVIGTSWEPCYRLSQQRSDVYGSFRIFNTVVVGEYLFQLNQFLIDVEARLGYKVRQFLGSKVLDSEARENKRNAIEAALKFNLARFGQSKQHLEDLSWVARHGSLQQAQDYLHGILSTGKRKRAVASS